MIPDHPLEATVRVSHSIREHGMAILQLLFGAPRTDWIHFFAFLTGIILFIFIAEKTRARLGWSAEINRKLVHVMTGVLVFFCPFFFVSAKPLVWMAAVFIAVDFIGVETGKLKGMHGTARKSFGTVFYPLTFLFLVLTCWNGHKAVLTLSMLILAFSDAAAAVVGENLRHPHAFSLWKDKKSLEGSAAMFGVSFLIVWLLLPVLSPWDHTAVSGAEAAWIGLVTAVFATVLEALSGNGSDNLSSPLGAAFIIAFMLSSPVRDDLRLSAGAALGLIIALASLRLRFLAPSGAAATFVLAALLFGIGGWPWTFPILAFFVSSSLLSKTGKSRKKSLQSIYEKTGTRDIGQVAANGGTACLFALLSHFFPNPIWYKMHLGAVAAVNADTWATEIGIFSVVRPRSLVGFRPVPPGTSGGVTPLGTLGALAGSILIAAAGWVSAPQGSQFPAFGPLFRAVVLAGFTASLADSVIGATLQAQYRCPVCGKITEKRTHCRRTPTLLISGLAFVNNDWVNWICSVAGAGAVWASCRIGSF
jgi:uncharacterized protein (TIGR00297 family)